MLAAIQRQLRPPAAPAPAAGAEPLGCVEMRTYFASPGKLEALHSRFRDHTCALFAKHGITNLGYFSPLEDDSDGGRLVYFIGAPSRAERDASFAAFQEDPAWVEAKAASEVDGGLVARVDSVFLEATGYSAGLGPLARDGQLLELRRYAAAEGKGDALNARFREGGPTWLRSGLTAVATLQPTPSEDTAPDGEVWLLIAPPSQPAAAAAYDR